MAIFTENVHEAIRVTEEKHKDDIPMAVKKSMILIKSLPNYEEIVEALLHQAVQTLVYHYRHQRSRVIKKAAGKYGGPQKVSQIDESISRIYQEVYEYRIGGTMLGKLYGHELAPLAETEGSLASGHLFNQELLNRLDRITPKEKMVEEAVPARKLRSMFQDVYRKYHGQDKEAP